MTGLLAWKTSESMRIEAKTPDGQSYKEIRTLLSTMHSVMWDGGGSAIEA